MNPALLDSAIARKMHRTLEAYHGMIYFAPAALAEYQALGLTADQYFKGYFASRASAMGAVPGEVVLATFFNFHPDLVCSAVPSCWDVADPVAWQRARLRGADTALQSMLGEQVHAPEVSEAVALARRAADQCAPAGRPLFAAHASLAWPEPPHLALWHAVTLLREYRGDGHIAALVAADVSPCQALVLHDATGLLPPGVLQSSRSWSNEEWETARESLRSRGWLIGNEFSDAGRAARDAIETQTDELAMAPWRALGEDDCKRLRELVRPMSKTIVESGALTGFRPR